MAAHGAGAAALQRRVVAGGADAAPVAMRREGKLLVLRAAPPPPPRRRSVDLNGRRSVDASSAICDGGGGSGNGDGGDGGLPADLAELSAAYGLAAFAVEPVGPPAAPLGALLVARAAPARDPVAAFAGAGRAAESGCGCGGRSGGAAAGGWRMRLHAASVALLQHVRGAAATRVPELLCALHDAQDPVALISVLLRVRVWGSLSCVVCASLFASCARSALGQQTGRLPPSLPPIRLILYSHNHRHTHNTTKKNTTANNTQSAHRYMLRAAGLRTTVRLALLQWDGSPTEALLFETPPSSSDAPAAAASAPVSRAASGSAPSGPQVSAASATAACGGGGGGGGCAGAGAAPPLTTPADADAEVVAGPLELANTLLASAVGMRQARFIKDVAAYMQTCAHPARDVFTRASEVVSSLVVVPLFPVEDDDDDDDDCVDGGYDDGRGAAPASRRAACPGADGNGAAAAAAAAAAARPLGALYFALDSPCEWGAAQEPLLGFMHAVAQLLHNKLGGRSALLAAVVARVRGAAPRRAVPLPAAPVFVGVVCWLERAGAGASTAMP